MGIDFLSKAANEYIACVDNFFELAEKGHVTADYDRDQAKHLDVLFSELDSFEQLIVTEYGSRKLSAHNLSRMSELGREYVQIVDDAIKGLIDRTSTEQSDTPAAERLRVLFEQMNHAEQRRVTDYATRATERFFARPDVNDLMTAYWERSHGTSVTAIAPADVN